MIDLILPILVSQILFFVFDKEVTYKYSTKIIRHALLRLIFTYLIVFSFHFMMLYYLELTFVLLLGLITLSAWLFIKEKGGTL